MFHRNRVWTISAIDSLDELANKLYEHTWCCCNAFRYKDLLLLNDATSGDGAQEYAVVRLDDAPHIEPPLRGTQIESLTVSWYESEAKLLLDLQRLERNEPLGSSEGLAAIGVQPWTAPVEIRTHPASERCVHCA